LIAYDSFFTVKRVVWEPLEQNFRDQVLRQDIDLQLDVVRRCGVDRERSLEMRAQQLTRGVGCFGRDSERFDHAPNLNDSASGPRRIFRQKNREEKMNSPPGLKLKVRKNGSSPLFCGSSVSAVSSSRPFSSWLVPFSWRPFS
jgi:hypothetical protein